MREQADQIVLLRLRATLLEDLHESGETFHHFALPLFFPAGADVRIVHAGRHVGPMGQVATFFEWIVEQRGQHHRGQLDGDGVDPVERLTNRKGVEQALGARADQWLEFLEHVWGNGWLDRLALFRVARFIHCDEHRQLKIFRWAAQRDAAMFPAGREAFVVGIDRHDVFIAGDRPERADKGVSCVMHGGFIAQSLETIPHRLLPPEFRILGVQLRKRQRTGRRCLFANFEIAFEERITVSDLRALQGRVIKQVNRISSHQFSSDSKPLSQARFMTSASP